MEWTLSATYGAVGGLVVEALVFYGRIAAWQSASAPGRLRVARDSSAFPPFTPGERGNRGTCGTGGVRQTGRAHREHAQGGEQREDQHDEEYGCATLRLKPRSGPGAARNASSVSTRAAG